MQKTATISADRAAAPATTRWRLWAATALLAALAIALGLVNLPYAPAPWFDEGSHMQVPKTLVNHGVYADISSEGFRYFGPTIGVGPTVMLPIAAMFQLFGAAPVLGRLVVVGYFLLALALAALLARRLHGAAAIPLTLALLLASRTNGFGGMVEYGRQALGEVPGVAFLLLGALFWAKAVAANAADQPRSRHILFSALSGLGFGLALITKNQFALIVGPGLALIALLDLVYYRQGSWWLRALPLGIASACFGGWTVVMLTMLGPSTFSENLALTRQAAGGAIFVFDPAATLRAARYIVQPYLGLLLPALAYALWRCRRPTRAALAELPLALLPALWIAWYLISLGWPRYAFPAVALGAFAVARMLIDLVGWLSDRNQERGLRQAQATPTGFDGLSRRLRGLGLPPAARSAIGHRLSAIVILYAALAIVFPIGLSVRMIAQPDDGAYRMADYLNAHIPTATIVETWEPELGVITDHRYHFPPIKLLDQAVRGEWLGADRIAYPVPDEPPHYLVVGAFGRYSGVYNAWVQGESTDNPALDPTVPYRLVVEFGSYALYELKTRE